MLDGNRLTGSADAEIYGSDAADHYVGGHGNDTLNGNISNDHYYFNLGDGHDTIIEGSYSSGAWYYSAYDELHFGPGINWESLQANKLNNDLVITVSPADTVTIKDWFLNNRTQVDVFRFADGSVRTATDFTRLTNSFHGTEGNDVVTGSASVDSILYGHGGDDTLNAGSANDMLYGGSGNDSLAGNSGNDALYGEAGDDMLDGGFGNDNYYFSRNGGQDVISDSSGSDFVHFDATVTASEFALSRTANDLVLTNTVTGDRITLRDYMNGDIDPYIYVGSNVVNYNNAAAIESIFFADGSALPSGSEIQDELLNMRGTGSDDTLSGTAWADVLYGYDGNDTLYGFDDDDVLYGGNGNDYLDGGIGRTNLLYGQGGDDVLVGNANGSDSFGHSYLHGGFGNDTYLYKPGASFNAYDDGGDDKIVFDSAIRLTDIRFRRWNDELNISSSGGPDDIIIPNHFISDSYKIEHIQLADGTLIGLRDVQEGTGAKDVLNGTAEDSILLGDYDTDTLNGNDGNDWLDGGLSGDAMLGGRGDDIYIVDSAKDSVTELANQGTDTVLSAVGYTLDANVERLVLMGTGKMNGTGNALDNVITGNSAANTLSGNAGNDWLDGQGGIDKLIGGAGDDTLVVDNAGETLTERSNEGTDTVRSSVTFTLPNHIENLTLIGTLAISATGNALNNTLIGNGAGNTLSGDAGNDILDGAVGNDTLIGGKGGDIYRFGRDGGVDTISENDATANTIDIVQCLPSIDADQLWFQHVGNNLEVSVIGTADKLILQNWYLGAAYHLEQFKTAGGLTLQHDSVESLVQAMAPLAVPEIGQFELPPEYAANLDPLITSLWL
ncbi:MAG: hypothetical protein LZF61_07775 [Nitrosomonas sp.]|nr:MAG: hypothetical protein LZF61_07775 [Nitrosomonas sp.]